MNVSRLCPLVLLGPLLLAACGRAPTAESALPAASHPTPISAQGVTITTFKHPGIAISQANLDGLRAAVASGQAPTLQGWQKVTSSRFASPTHTARPFATITTQEGGPYASDTPYGSGDLELREDSLAAFLNALQWRVTGKSEYAQAAIRIMNSWAGTLQEIKGHNTKLLAAHAAVRWANAAELIRGSGAGWRGTDQDRFALMLRREFYEPIKTFQGDYYGNWDAAMINALMAMGVYLNDNAMFNLGWDRYLGTEGRGALRNYIHPTTYEVAETCRDQAHAQMGLGYLAGAAEVAYNQGYPHLYTAYNHLLLRGYEFEARYILGKGNVPLQGCTNGPQDRAAVTGGTVQLYPVWEIAYNHYHHRSGFNTTYTSQLALKVRPEGDIHMLLGFGTALYARP